MSVVEAVRRELAELERLDKELARGPLAMAALALAGEVDDPATSSTSKAMCVRALIEATDRIRSLAPVAQESDRLDEIAAKRKRRRVG